MGHGYGTSEVIEIGQELPTRPGQIRSDPWIFSISGGGVRPASWLVKFIMANNMFNINYLKTCHAGQIDMKNTLSVIGILGA
ncbi:MAG: hypothetical protein HQM04_08505 [Magnetococcales bacterium]|nr:hypothetical protein [Magnetococcales bacterium]MBF0115072.1 hypothetical protein [Magnetococcales bacterium]